MHFLLGLLFGYYIRGKASLLAATLLVIALLCFIVLPAIALSGLALSVRRERLSRPPQTRFRRTDLANLDLKKLLHTSRIRPQDKCYQRPHSVNSQGAAKILSVPKKTIAELVKNGVLTPYLESPKTPGEYIFNRSSIERLVGQFVNLTNLISAGAAAEILRTRTLRRQWIKPGYLKYEISRDGKKEFLIKSDVERIACFLNSVVNRQRAEKILGVSGHFVNALCKEWLRPIQNPYPRAFRDTIYLRAHFEKLRSELNFNGKKLLSKLSEANRNGIRRSRLPVTQ